MINYFTLVTFHTHVILHTVPAFTETKTVLVHDYSILVRTQIVVTVFHSVICQFL